MDDRLTMPAESGATRPTADRAHAISDGNGRRLRLGVDALREGVFVSDLDRPWLDTPFLIQGFMVGSAIELSTLRRYCRFVYVDLDRSVPEVATAIAGERSDTGVEPDGDGPDAIVFERNAPIAEAPRTCAAGTSASVDGQEKPGPAAAGDSGPPATAGGGAARAHSPRVRAHRMRSDVRISKETRNQFRVLVRGKPVPVAGDANGSLARRALSQLRGLFSTNTDAAGGPAASRTSAGDSVPAVLRAEIAQVLPPGVAPATYEVRHEVAVELPRARNALAGSEQVLDAVVGDIRNGRVVAVEQIAEAVDRMVESMIDNPDALLWVAQMRAEHKPTYQHGVRVALYMMNLGRQLGFPRELLGQMGMVGMLADVGKTRIPRALLEKPGMLSPPEFSIVKEHVRLGLEALAQGSPIAHEVELGISQHHERLDGSGYPKGLRGDEISLYGRMAAIADSFAALSTPRAYANPLAPQDALMSLYQWADTSFHGPLVEQFVQAIGVFPVGSLVELSSGEVGVVVAHNRVRRLEPRVLLLTWPDKRPLAVPVEIDLLHQSREAQSRPLRVIRGLPSGAYGLKPRDYYADGPIDGAFRH